MTHETDFLTPPEKFRGKAGLDAYRVASVLAHNCAEVADLARKVNDMQQSLNEFIRFQDWLRENYPTSFSDYRRWMEVSGIMKASTPIY